MNDLPGFWQSLPVLVYLRALRLSLAVTWIWATTSRARPDLTNCIPTDLFPHWAKKVCILFSPMSVTNRSRDVVRRASLSLSLCLSLSSKKAAWWNVYILHPGLPHFYLLNSLHTWESALKLATTQAIYTRQWCTRFVARNKNISIKSMATISHFAEPPANTHFFVVDFPQLFFLSEVWKNAEGRLVNRRLKKTTGGQRELRHISPVLIWNVTKWWILRSRTLQQEMNSDLRAVDLGAPTASWEIIWLQR